MLAYLVLTPIALCVAQAVGAQTLPAVTVQSSADDAYSPSSSSTATKGSAPLRDTIHRHFGDALKYSCSVGGTHWDELGSGKGLPGPRPTLFFAPAQIKKRLGDWGPAGLGERIAAAWLAFMTRADDPATPWLTVKRGQGAGEVERVYRDLVEGRTNPREGHVLSL